MKELRFYIGDVAVKLYETYVGSPNPLDRIELQESESFDRDYTVIETFPANYSSEFLITKKASDLWASRWYRILWVGRNAPTEPVPHTGENVQILSGQEYIYGDTGPIVPEEIQSILDDIRMHMGDTDLENPAWKDREYVQHIRFALRQFKGSANIAKIRDEDIVPIVLICRIAFANILSYDHAKYYALQAPGVTLDKSQIHSHYSQVARDLQESYDNIAKRLGLDAGGQNEKNVITTMPKPMEGETIRWSNYRNGYVELNPGGMNRRRFFREPSVE